MRLHATGSLEVMESTSFATMLMKLDLEGVVAARRGSVVAITQVESSAASSLSSKSIFENILKCNKDKINTSICLHDFI